MARADSSAPVTRARTAGFSVWRDDSQSRGLAEGKIQVSATTLLAWVTTTPRWTARHVLWDVFDAAGVFVREGLLVSRRRQRL